MRWMTWLPWRYAISRLARSRGLIDPIAVLARLHRFGQPSEVTEPIELMRAGLILQARGLINTRAIQHNLDWIWPYWIERQFNPRDASFIPRAFSVTHVNLTHRNWTAVGQPNCAQMPIVDPRGLVTPLFDGWSLDAWLLPQGEAPLLPSRARDAAQRMLPGDELAVETEVQRDGCHIRSVVDVVWQRTTPCCRLRVEATAPSRAWLAIALRPANPEGVSFIGSITVRKAAGDTLDVNRNARVHLSQRPERICMSDYRRGDVYRFLPHGPPATEIRCDVGLASAAALYHVSQESPATVTALVPLTGPFAHPQPGHKPPPRHGAAARPAPAGSWSTALEPVSRFDVPDEQLEFLFRNAVRNLVLFSPEECYPGPYTSKRFWFRDATYILNALISVGLADHAARVLEHYPDRQHPDGFFRSQEGEWDANGQALWILDRFRRLTGQPLSARTLDAVRRGVQWIDRKRLSDGMAAPHAGLMPAGFSAEHLGPNDYFYWDDFWSVAGLEAAARTLRDAGDSNEAHHAEQVAALLLAAIDRSLEQTAAQRGRAGVPASPYRRMDAGAIGSLAAGYPTQLWAARDPRLRATTDFLMEHCRVHGGFFQDVIHSGVNVYLSLQLAQVLLRARDRRQEEIVWALARLASPTGNWPEAIHPHTFGGCMGDGQHIWAAAEWVLMMRNWFVREEQQRLVVGAGIPAKWLDQESPLRFGPTPTPYGPITVEIRPAAPEIVVSWEADWRGPPPKMEVTLPGQESHIVSGEAGHARIARRKAVSNLTEVRP